MSEITPKTHKTWQWIKLVLSIAKWPILVVIIAYAVYISMIYLFDIFLPGFKVESKAILSVIFQITLMLCIYWFFLNNISYIRFQLQIYLKQSDMKYSFFLLDFLINAIKIIILLSLFSFIIDLMPLSTQYNYFAERIISILIIAAVTWISINLIKIMEALINTKYKLNTRTDLLAQKARTQILVLKRIAIGLVVLVSVGSILLLFENVRNFGAGLLTSAGILAVVGTFAVKKPLENLADSLQIVFNKLIKINDIVVIEKEFGTIEEINLSCVVVKIWDLRRLIVPISYFIEKPFINLSRSSTDILAIIKLYVDYTLPIEPAREALKNISENSDFWDKETCVLEITDSRELTMEIRILLSAKSSSDAWKLQCEVREKMIQFIRENYPGSLPRLRTQMKTKAV
jgi:small-conductance mechanosensitive channel